MKKVRSASITLFFTITVLLLSPSAAYAGTNLEDTGACDAQTLLDAGIVLDLIATDGDASITWGCDDIFDFSFFGINHNDETEVHICVESFDDSDFGDCDNDNLDNDLDFSSFVLTSGSVTGNTISVFYKAGDLELNIEYEINQLSSTVAELSITYSLRVVDGGDTESVRFFHTTDADVDPTADGSDDSGNENIIEYDGAGTLTFSEGGITYEVIAIELIIEENDIVPPLPDFVGICDEDADGDECQLNFQPFEGHLTLLPGVAVPQSGQGDWESAFEYDFDVVYLDDDTVIEILERITIPETSEPPPPLPPTVGGEFLPIDSTALLLAGLQTSAIWMLPVLAGAAGVGAYYIKTRMNKDN